MALLRPHRGQVPRRLIARGSLAAVLALVPLVGLPVGGCNIVAPIAYAIEGPGMIDAAFTLEKTRTAILVDDQRTILPRTSLRVELGEAIATRLLDEKAVPEVVSTRDVIAYVRTNERSGKRLSMEAVAKGLKVDQLIFVEVAQFSLVDENGSPRPTSSAFVRVLDIDGKMRAFPSPEETEGREVQAQLREISTDLLRTPSGRRGVEDQLADRLGRQISRLFYEHERVDLGENLGPR
ncbi:MAG: hypothetical protein ACO38V_00830 [Phycisphaerales bacterium]